MSWEAWGDGDDGSGDYEERLLDNGWLATDQVEVLVEAARGLIHGSAGLIEIVAAFDEVFGPEYMRKPPEDGSQASVQRDGEGFSEGEMPTELKSRAETAERQLQLLGEHLVKLEQRDLGVCFECDGPLHGPFCPACNPGTSEEVKALVEALKDCRTSTCGYNLRDASDAYLTVDVFWREIQRIDGVARSALASISRPVADGEG